MLKTKWILLITRLNTSVHRVHGSQHSSQVYSNIETHLRPLPPHPPIAILTELLVVPPSSSVHLQLHTTARALNELSLPRQVSQPGCSNNSLDCRPRKTQPSLKYRADKVYRQPAHPFFNTPQQMYRTLPPPRPTRLICWLHTSMDNSTKLRL